MEATEEKTEDTVSKENENIQPENIQPENMTESVPEQQKSPR